ncbi:MAG: cupin-like domain-containing protein [Byssovorax sp.]
MVSPVTIDVPRVAGCSREELERRFVEPGRPVILEGVATSWEASRRWTLPYLREAFGGAEVQVMRAPRGKVDTSGNGGTTYDPTTIGAYIDALLGGASDPGYLSTMWDTLPAGLRAEVPWPSLCGEPPFRQSTLWLGPAGIVSPMHFDVADNLYVVVRGKKRFTLVAPRESLRVYPHGPFSRLGQYARLDPERAEAFPRYAGAHPQIAELGDGDALYLPRFWWHHARGLDLTMAVNFWWGNGMYAAMALAADGWKRLRGLSR